MNSGILNQFNDAGYVLIRDAIDEATVRKLRQIFLSEFKEQKTNVIPDAVIKYPDILQVLRAPKLLDALLAILGKPFVVPPHSSVEHNRYGVFHADTTGAEISGETFHQDPGFRMVTVAVYLQDNNEHGGGIRLVPGSHRGADIYVDLTKKKTEYRSAFNRSPLKKLLKKLSRGRLFDWDKPFRNHPDERDIDTKAGDALIWDMRIAHRASPQKVKATINGGKIAIFFTAGINTDITNQAYMKYVNSASGNSFLQEARANPGLVIPSDPNFIVL